MTRRQSKIRLNEEEREMMRNACRFNAELLDVIRPDVKPGVKTGELDRIIHEYTVSHGHVPACLHYPGGDAGPYPKSSCISVNEVICHGIPGDYELKPGDIANVDLTTIVDGWHGDQSETLLIGEDHQISDVARRVTQCAFDCLYLGIEATSPGCRISVIGQAIVDHVKEHYGFGVVDKYVGHGIGARFHQPPNIPHVPSPAAHRDRLQPGMCFTIEPMINAGTAHSVCDRSDGWTVRTQDGRLSAQFEHTILMTENGPEILTTTKDGPERGFKF